MAANTAFDRCAKEVERLLAEATSDPVDPPGDDLKIRAAALYLQLAELHKGGA